MFRKSILIITTILLCSHAFAFEAKYEYPKAFIENKAQFDGRNKLTGTKILYAIDHGPFQVYFTATGMTYRFDKKLPRQKWDKTKPINSQEEWEAILAKRKAVRMESTLYHIDFANANPAVELVASEPLQEYFSYGMGSNSLHYNFIKGFKQLTYKNLYPGIDLEFTFHPEKGFKYQFVVKPGADPNMIALVYNGDAPPRMDDQGNILLTTPFGDAVDHSPISFLGKDKKSIKTSFQMTGNKITFALSPYDNKKQLVIDPWVVFPPSPNSNKVWEVETDNTGNVYAYMGDSPFYLRKYNSTGSLQWSYSSSWDSSGFWVGGMVTHPNGDTYITTGSNGEIRKISPNGALVWYNNPNSLTSYEYWSLAFNCDLTQLVVGGSRATFSIPFPVIRGTMMNINLANGAIASTTVVGFGNINGIPPKIQEASSICSAPNGKFYFLTLDTVGSINNQLNTIGFKIPTSYNFDYYIPGYGFGTKQPISATRANGSALYTHDGQTLHKRDLLTGAVLATASIPSGIINTNPLFGSKTQGNGGLDLDNCGNVYVGSGNGVYKFDAALNLIASASTSGPVYDVDVSNNGEVAASGVNFVATVVLTACPQVTYVCGNPVLATVTSTAVSCAGTCDGTAMVNPIGGTTPYSYAWSTGATVASISGLCAGNYTVTVTDAAGTSAVQTVAVVTPAPLVANASAVNQITCNGANNGSAVVSVTGGAGQITYSWNTTPPQSGTSINNLSPGTYVLTITDTSGCQDTLAVTITEPAPIALQVSSTPSSCNQSNGTATVVASGGTGAYTYSWNSIPVQSTATATGLTSGNYFVLVTDANGCTAQASSSVTGFSSVSASVSTVNNVSCNGISNGGASVTSIGGIGNVSYTWNTTPIQTGPNLVNVPAGNYQVIAIDSLGCRDSLNITIAEPDSLIAIASSTASNCLLENGSVSVQVIGGVAPYFYTWNTNPVQTGPMVMNLGVGTYLVSVIDSNGCNTQSQASIVSSSYLDGVLISSNDVTCNGLTNGSASVNASGGIGAIIYQWNSSPPQSGPLLSNVGVGTYQVTLTDSAGCIDSLTVIISEPPILSLQSSTTLAFCGNPNGTASVQVSGGVLPYSYFWSTTPVQNASTANNLAAGNYNVTVADFNGCILSSNLTVGAIPLPSISIDSLNSVSCNGYNDGSVFVSASGGVSPYLYSWNISPSQVGSSLSNIGAGNYQVIAMDFTGCMDTLLVSIPEPLPISLSTSIVPSSCSQPNGTATVNAIGGVLPYNYNWNTNPVQTTATAVGLQSGTYDILVTDNNGCTAQTQVFVAGTSLLSLNATSQTGCATLGSTANISVSNGTAPYTYNWTPPLGNSANVNGLSAGSYQCLVTDASGCSNSILVNISTYPSPVAFAGNDTIIAPGQQITLAAAGGTSFAWTPSTGVVCDTCQSTAAFPLSTTTYCVLVTDLNGCTDTACKTVTINDIDPEPCGEVFIPSAFSPDAVNDPENDRFCVYGRCIATLSLSVFDRWGKLVFETSDKLGCWDGTYKGKALNTGVYMYVAKVSLSNGENKVLKGDVSLVR